MARTKSSADREPNSNSRLKTLPEERQEVIFGWCTKANDQDGEGKEIPRTGGLAHAQAQLAADGITVSEPVLSEFRRWYRARQRYRRSLASSEQQRELMAKFRPGDAALAREFAEFTLLQQANEVEDPELIQIATGIHDKRRTLDLTEESGRTKAAQKAEQLAQGRERLKLDREKFEALLAKEAKAKETLGDSSLNAEQREARMKQIFGVQ